MGHDDPNDWQAAEPLGKDLLPQLLGSRHRITGIDDGPTLPVFEQPQIDMIEREGEGHAQPLHGRERLPAPHSIEAGPQPETAAVSGFRP